MTQYNIISKFIKDLSFEVPDVETLLYIEQNINKYNLKVDVTSKPLKNKLVQLETILKLEGDEELKRRFHLEINVAAIVRFEEKIEDKKGFKKILLVSVPNELYPIIYEVVSNLLKKSGLPNLEIKQKIDFNKLYESQKK
jgi:preprotein translocase subunit SecB